MTYSAEVDLDEVLVRIIRTPQFCLKGKLRANALRPQRGSDRVSVVRWPHREQPGEVFKARCHKIGNSGSNTFCGLGVLSASSCLEVDLGLEDDRESFDGHANIVYPFAVKDSEPQEGEAFVRQAEIATRILSKAQFVLDPEPASAQWTIKHEQLPA